MKVTALVASEDDLLTAIVEAAALLGWRVHHDRRSDLARQQGHVGFPDVIAIRGGRVKAFELKSERGQLSTDQFAWAREMPQNSHAFEYRVVRPADLDSVVESLR
jgi:hypothetical protein